MMRLLTAILVVLSPLELQPHQGVAQTPPYGYWRGWNGVCPDLPNDSFSNGMCSSATEGCQSLAAKHDGTLMGMKPRYYADGGVAGCNCAISSLS
jgi:hypothetical protein